MKLDRTESTLVITAESAQVKSHQALQLAHWGFERNSDKTNFIYPKSASTSFVSKILSYLRDEFGIIDLGENLKGIVDESEKKVNDFEGLKKLSLGYKKGNVNIPGFKEFKSFVGNELARKLKLHQLKAAFHLYLLKSAANFSVPGSGKTSVVLSVYEKLRREGKVNMLFVIGPLASFAAWRDEFETTLGRKPQFQILAGGQRHSRKAQYHFSKSRRAELYLTSFQTLHHDKHEAGVLLQQKGVMPFIVVDEAHYIKQIGGNWSSAVVEMGKLSSNKCILTGTPFPKNYSDVFNLTDFLWPETPPFDEPTKSKIRYLENKNRAEESEEARDTVKKIIEPLFYRVKKKDLNLKRQDFHEPIICKMNKIEGRVYSAIRDNIRKFSRQEYMRNAEVLQRLKRGRIIRLRQTVSYAKLVGTALDDYREDLVGDNSDFPNLIRNYDKFETPAKIQALIRLLKSFGTQKVVIWSNFVDVLKLIKRHVQKEGYQAKVISGAVPVQNETPGLEETREKIIKEFLDIESGMNILIANPAACAESISLHKSCSHAVYYDLSYNCAQYLQSLDRIHRVGGSETKVAHYYYLQYEDSLDQDIKENVEKKARRMTEIIDEDCKIYSLDMFGDEDDVDAYDRLFGKKA